MFFVDSRQSSMRFFLVNALLVARSHAYLRSATACTGNQVIATESECQTAALALNVYTYNSGANVGTEWPNGCFFHGTTAYWQPSTQTGTNRPIPTDGFSQFLCRSGFATSLSTCSGGSTGVDVSSIASCMEASSVVGYSWNSYQRTTQCATGTTAMASVAECSNSGNIAFTTFSYNSDVGTEWRQGCFIHGSNVFSQMKRQTGTNVPAPSDGGGAFICRKSDTVGTEWPMGCFVHNTKVYFQPNAQTGAMSPSLGKVPPRRSQTHSQHAPRTHPCTPPQKLNTESVPNPPPAPPPFHRCAQRAMAAARESV
jgi:hypothetical protein